MTYVTCTCTIAVQFTTTLDLPILIVSKMAQLLLVHVQLAV